jgi:hypothetical protein
VRDRGPTDFDHEEHAMYGFSLNNPAGEQMDPLLRFGSTPFGGLGSLPGAPNGQMNGAPDSISRFGGNGFASNAGSFGSNGANFASNGGNFGSPFGSFGSFGSSSGAGLASMLGSFGSYVQNLFGQIAQWIQNYSSQLQTLASGQSSTSGSASSGSSSIGQYGNGQYGNGQYGNGQYGNGQYGNGQYGNGQYGTGQFGTGQYGNGQYGLSTAQQNLGPQQYFTNADASSVGDPHDAFNGTSNTNGNLSNRWDDMHSHGQLLSSDSFRGGYRVSTRACQPNSNGVTTNSSATVTTDGGNTAVTLNADGTSSVVRRGQPVTLQAGTSTSLGNGESVTLNADGSLSVQMQNQNGGTIATTLKVNNGGVDVSDHAENVDLGGYLVTRSEGAAN